jgi:hypothetical protein
VTDVPIACTLTGSSFQDRLAEIAQLVRDGLRTCTRRDLDLDLHFAPEVAGRVRDMVRKEQACCGFLTFEISERPDDIRLTISAPERARDAADALFEQFLAGVSQR